MFLDDFDPYSTRSTARRAQQHRHEREAFGCGLETSMPHIPAPVLPIAHEAPHDRAIPVMDVGPRERGVYEREASWPGSRCFLVVSETGEFLMETTVPARVVTGRFIHGLWRFLNAQDPRPALKAV